MPFLPSSLRCFTDSPTNTHTHTHTHTHTCTHTCTHANRQDDCVDTHVYNSEPGANPSNLAGSTGVLCNAYSTTPLFSRGGIPRVAFGTSPEGINSTIRAPSSSSGPSVVDLGTNIGDTGAAYGRYQDNVVLV
eukprot:COSAG02_NODE_414_length_22826_cov_9.001364_5_plen_133_part_00